MSMDKRWKENFERLGAIEAELKEISKPQAVFTVTKEELMKINGVGSSTADKILELFYGK